MALYLNVPYKEKDIAKNLGAKWDPQIKKWYVENRRDYKKFTKWILGDDEEIYILCDYLYIVEEIRTCFKCKNKTTVIGYGVKKYFHVYDSETYGMSTKLNIEEGDNEIHIASHIYPLPDKLLEYLKVRYGYYESYSNTTKSSYLANHCTNCKVIQGDFNLLLRIP